jgi:ribulose 1,5-bisphosphate synthetase/thiazole synthase
MSKYKKNDIVLIQPSAGPAMPKIHVRLIERVVVPKKGAWTGYSGWDAELVYKHEVDLLRKEWSIPFEKVGDRTFVYDSEIIRRVKNKKNFR